MISEQTLVCEEISFDEISPFWRLGLWPNRVSPIEPASSMLYLGGYDTRIKTMFKPRFFAVRNSGKIIGVNSGHQTSATHYRSRGIFVDPNNRWRTVGRTLLAAAERAARETSCQFLWSLPRQTVMAFYGRCGFVQTTPFFTEGMEFGPNCYASKEISADK